MHNGGDLHWLGGIILIGWLLVCVCVCEVYTRFIPVCIHTLSVILYKKLHTLYINVIQ